MTDPLRGEWTSASNALADRICRGRFQAQIGLPELARSEAGDSGTVIHALWTGARSPRDATAEEREKAQALREQETIAARDFFGKRRGLVRLVERRLWHELNAQAGNPPAGRLKTSGQFDVTVVHPKSRRALICDGKSGWLPVTPNPSNLQLRRLATLMWLQIDAVEVGVCILKPFGKMESPCVYTVADLERSLNEMAYDIHQSHEPNAIRTAGEEQCRYCRARQGCATRLVWLSAALPPLSPPLPMISAREWTPAQRVLFLEREKDARDWLETRKTEIKALLAEVPDAAPGYTLKRGRTVENITNGLEVFKHFHEQLGGTLEAFMKCIKIGKTVLKDEVRRLSGHKGKALEADMKKLLLGCFETHTAAPTIERI